ncbi:AT-rich interactive domain-containing protein 2-like [Uloborus diversus]|uniref:AT-rich interactive domain-containing protein 2-like n=1 Tax=Uloborus diversus TaxID=327109 RepID=UPI00240943A7|nr:AT-rich interactive domain-containing protein 2-like [Uloborus diversus]
MESLHKSGQINDQHYNAFLHELKIFHQNRGSPFHHIPKISGREINLLHFYNVVTEAGGFKVITEQRKWNDIASILKFPRGCVNISLSLRKIYIRYLKHYEKIHFLRIQKSDNVKAGSQTKKLKICQNVPMVYDIAQHDISDACRSSFGLNETFVSPNHYIKLCMSLLCGLPNEQELALNICILLSSKENFNFDLSQSPKLIDFLIAQSGIWNSDDAALKTLYLESWRDVKGRNMAWFWRSVLNIRNDQLAEFLGSDLNEHNSDESLLNIRQGIWCPSFEGELVFKIAVIIYNLSFEKKNKSVLADNKILLRFLLLCIHSSWGSLKQTAYDTLGNIAVELKVSTEQDIYSRVILQTVIEGISSADRFIVIKSMDILSQLCYCIANEDVITSLLNVEVYEQLLLYLTVHDIVLLTHSLDALYALSDLGKYPCDKIASGHHFVATLVSLLTCEADKFEQSAYINMKIIKTLYPVESDLNKEVASTSTNSLKTGSSTTGGSENITCKWLTDKYEKSENFSCSQEEMFSQYVSFCQQSDITQNGLSSFHTYIKSVFPDCKLKVYRSKSGAKSNRYYGLKKKPSAQSTVSKTSNVSHSFSSHHESVVVDNPINEMKAQTFHHFKSVSENQKNKANGEGIKTLEEKSEISLSPALSLKSMPPDPYIWKQNSTPNTKMVQKNVPDSISVSNKEKLLPCSINKRKISFTADTEHVEINKTAKYVDSPVSTPITFISLKQKLISKISEDVAQKFYNKTNTNQSIASAANDSASVNHHCSSNVIPTATCSVVPLINCVPIDSLNGIKSPVQNISSIQDPKLRAEIEKIILVSQSPESLLSKSIKPSNEISFDKHYSLNSSKNNIVSKQLIFSNISSPSVFLSSPVKQNSKEFSSVSVLGLQSDTIISKSPLLSSILNKGTELVARSKSNTGTENCLSSKDSNLKIISNVQESTCLKIVPVSSLNTTFKIASHNLENASCLSQNPVIAASATQNSIAPNASSCLDVLPIVPICIENCNNNVASAVAYEIISEKNSTSNFQVQNPEDSVQKTSFVSLQSSAQVLNNTSLNSVVSNKQVESQSAAIKLVLNNFSEEKELSGSRILLPYTRSSSSKEMKQVPSTVCENMKYSCNWRGCGLKFSKIPSMFLHISQVHVPASDDDMICLWDGCGPMKRPRMSLLTHLQDWHCNETSLNSQSIKKQQLPLGRKTAAHPPPNAVYSSDAAIIAIRRRALQDIDPNKQSARKTSSNEKEQALEESIRLTSALILRNLVSYSPMARTYIRRYESELVHLAMCQSESSTILAQCLSYLT